jgi:hypothetical protein
VGKDSCPRSMESSSGERWTGIQGGCFNSVIRAGNERKVMSCCVASQLEKCSCSGTDMVSQLRCKCFKRNVV